MALCGWHFGAVRDEAVHISERAPAYGSAVCARCARRAAKQKIWTVAATSPEVESAKLSDSGGESVCEESGSGTSSVASSGSDEASARDCQRN